MRRIKLSVLVGVAMLIAAVILFRAPTEPPPEIFGTLSRRDAAAIARVVRREMRRQILPTFSVASLRQLPSSLRQYWTDRILSIQVTAGDTVEVMTGVSGERFGGHGMSYQLKRRPSGWVISSSSLWISRTNESPDTRPEGTVASRRDSSLDRLPDTAFAGGRRFKSHAKDAKRATAGGGNHHVVVPGRGTRNGGPDPSPDSLRPFRSLRKDDGVGITARRDRGASTLASEEPTASNRRVEWAKNGAMM